MSIFYYNSETGDKRTPDQGQVEADGRIYVQPSAETLLTLGYEQVIIGPRPDERFYIVTGPDNAGAYSSTPKDLDEVKASFLKIEDTKAGAALASTDWYVVRELEISEAIPADVQTYRAAVRTVNNENEAIILLAADIPALEALINAPEEVREDVNDVTSAMVANSDPHLSSYPRLAE